MIGVFQTVDDFHNDFISKFGSPWEYRNGANHSAVFYYYESVPLLGTSRANACKEGF